MFELVFATNEFAAVTAVTISFTAVALPFPSSTLISPTAVEQPNETIYIGLLLILLHRD